MMLYVIFNYSGNSQRFLNDSTYFQNLLKASIGTEKKIVGKSGLFRTSMTIHVLFLDDLSSF